MEWIGWAFAAVAAVLLTVFIFLYLHQKQQAQHQHKKDQKAQAKLQTEMSRMQKELYHERDIIGLIQEHMVEGILILDDSDKIQLANRTATALLSIEKENWDNKSIFILTDNQAFLDALRKSKTEPQHDMPPADDDLHKGCTVRQLLKIDGSGYRHARLGDSDRLRIGTEVAAIGNPLGDLDYSLNVGYISAKDRDVDLDGPSIRMMQLDAAINPGNSGGPLFDLRGNVVGVTTAKYSGETVTGATIEGIGFAIPINDVREILSELREYGRVPNRAQLGVMVGTVYSTNTARNGRVQVRDVTEDSAGAHAGLRDGDFILALDDYTVRTLSDLSAALRHYRGGQHATLTIERYGKTFRLPIVFDSKDDAVQNEEPTTSANALEPSEQDSPRP